MPLKELVELSHKGRARSSKYYLPIVEAIHASPDRKEILASDWGGSYLRPYLEHAASQLPDVKEAMALVPVGVVAPEMREELLSGWLDARPTAANMEAIFKLPADNMSMLKVMENAAVRVWTATPADRKELLAKIDALPGPQRNRVIGTLTFVIPSDDPAGMASVISQLSSFNYQWDHTERWLKKQGDEGKQKLIRELDAMPDNTSVRKLREKLAESSAGK